MKYAKKWCLMVCALLFSTLSADDEASLTYDYFVSNPYNDHVGAFQKLFQYRKINTFLEFGLGKGTKYFIDNCKNVISVELLIPSIAADTNFWYLKTVQMFQHHRNWQPYLYTCSSLFDYYERQTRKGIIEQRNFDTYVHEIDAIIAWAFHGQQPDVVFIDQGPVPRGYFVNRLFGKVNIIVAHDTIDPPPESVYRYNCIVADPRYVKITYTKGRGTTFWIRKEEVGLIKHLQAAFQ